MECPGGADRGGAGGVRFWFWKWGGDVGGEPYGIPLSPAVTSLTEPSPLSLRDISPHCGESPFSRGTRDSSALTGTSYRAVPFAPTVRPFWFWKRGEIVEKGGANLCTENRDSPEGGTGGSPSLGESAVAISAGRRAGLSAVRKIVFLRWIGG